MNMDVICAGCRLFFYSYQNALVPLAVEYISAQRQENILLYTLSGFYTYKYVGLFSSIISYLYFAEKTDT